jgi:hypothetical protein
MTIGTSVMLCYSWENVSSVENWLCFGTTDHPNGSEANDHIQIAKAKSISVDFTEQTATIRLPLFKRHWC